jgi:hypothetical protein
MPDHAGDRGAALPAFAPHDRLHIKQIRTVARSDIHDCTHSWIEVRHGTGSATLR